MKDWRYLLICYLLFLSNPVGAQDINWSCDEHAYEYDMSAFLTLKNAVDFVDLPKYKIAAFVGEECRGVAQLEAANDSTKYYYMRIRSNEKEGEVISFKCCNISNGKVYEVENTVIFEERGRIGYPSSPYSLLFKKFTPGDVNNDGIIVVDDVVLTINAVMGHDSDNFVFEAADMNGDGQILVDDVVQVIKAVLNSDNSNVAKVRGTVSGEEIALNANGNGFGMSVSNASAYSALQFDMVIPAGVNMDDVRVKQGGNHMVFFQKKGKGVMRAVVISLTNEPFTGNDLLDVKIETADEEVVLVTNACMVTRNGSVSQLADASVAVGGNYTDITEILNGTDKADIYDLSGRMVKKGATTTDGLMKGVYLVNGKKVVLK